MNEFGTPKVLISNCIEFEYCRWNANIIKSPLVQILKKFVDFHPVCAELEIGLGIPRDPVRIVLKKEEPHIIQPSSNLDFTQKMFNFAETYLESTGDLDGVILKAQSPSCGLYDTKYYQSEKKGAPRLKRGPGLFGLKVLEYYPNLAIETEGRLTNFRIREHWLKKLYTINAFRMIKESDSLHELIKFHMNNKFLFMAYNQEIMRQLGRIVANPKKLSFSNLIGQYSTILYNLFRIPPEYTSHINTLMHALGYFKKQLSHEEKSFFLDELVKYRAGWIPLFVLTNLIKYWIKRFNQNYLQKQTYFNPYPEELMNFDLKDTWRGRSYWSR